MPTPYSNVVFVTSVYFGDGTNTKTLNDILKSVEFEVSVRVYAICHPELDFAIDPTPRYGHGDWDDYKINYSHAEFLHCEVEEIEMYADDPDCIETIKMLMTKEQREEVHEIAQDLIEKNWKAKYEDQAISSFVL